MHQSSRRRGHRVQIDVLLGAGIDVRFLPDIHLSSIVYGTRPAWEAQAPAAVSDVLASADADAVSASDAS